jgi:hypothetical protein
VASLGRLRSVVDPTAATPEAADIKQAAASVADLPEITAASVSDWARRHPSWVRALGLAVGLSQESFKMILKHRFDTQGWVTLARMRPDDLVAMLDEEFDLLRLLAVQRQRSSDFGDLLVARAGDRGVAVRGIASGRKVEDEI